MCILVRVSIQHPVSCKSSPTPVVDLPVSTTIGSSVDGVIVEIFNNNYDIGWCPSNCLRL